MTVHIKRTLHKLETELKEIESPLRLSLHCYEMAHRMWTQCGRTFPEVAMKCHPCCNTDLSVKFCTNETRVANYFAKLQQVGLWPTVEPFRRFSVSSITSRLYRAQQNLKHTCMADTFCPLRIHLSDLVERVKQTKISNSVLHENCNRYGRGDILKVVRISCSWRAHIREGRGIAELHTPPFSSAISRKHRFRCKLLAGAARPTSSLVVAALSTTSYTFHLAMIRQRAIRQRLCWLKTIVGTAPYGYLHLAPRTSFVL